jgi:hypothetical protein
MLMLAGGRLTLPDGVIELSVRAFCFPGQGSGRDPASSRSYLDNIPFLNSARKSYHYYTIAV